LQLLFVACVFVFSVDETDSLDEVFEVRVASEFSPAFGRALSQLEHQRGERLRRTTAFGGFSALYDMTPDGHPIISQVPDVDGFWSNCGWSGNGFASAPAVGGCIAQLITGGGSDIDLSMFGWPRPGGTEKMVY
jgi:glycine/D-amino acid oxidase-like deaminating enzyme